MTFEDWESQVPAELKKDTLWRVEAYRLGLFLSDLAWIDTGKLLLNRRTIAVSDQLFRAAGNISSNVAEGYSRDTGKARAVFYQYASDERGKQEIGTSKPGTFWQPKWSRIGLI